MNAIDAPARTAVANADAKVRDLKQSLEMHDILDRWTGPASDLEQLRTLATALDDWRTWAVGRRVSADRIVGRATVLRSTRVGA